MSQTSGSNTNFFKPDIAAMRDEQNRLREAQKQKNTNEAEKAKAEAQKNPLVQQQVQQRISADNAPAVKFIVAEDKNGKIKVDTVAVVTDTDIISTSSVVTEPVIKAPNIISLMGLKIDLGGKIADFKNNYSKNYILSKSHNLLVAKFAEMKVGFYGSMLSLMGVNPDEIRSLQKEAAFAALFDIRVNLGETYFTGELVAIMGGPKKVTRTQDSVVKELVTQLTTQASKLGHPYTQEELLEIKIAQCEKILGKLDDQLKDLTYARSMHEMGISQITESKDV